MLPKISIIIPAHNEEVNLKRLFSSLEIQSYPRRRLEYIVIDDCSTDTTADLASKLADKVIRVNTRMTVFNSIELNKGLGLHAATGDLVYWMDADMKLLNNRCLELLAKPLIENSQITGTFANFHLSIDDGINNSLLRFISDDILQRDPLYQLFSPSVESSVISYKPDYWICKYKIGHIPPAGMVMYRRKQLLSVIGRSRQEFLDLASVEVMVKNNHDLFAFVPQARIAHYHAKDLMHLVNKRLRNLNKSYLANVNTPNYYSWIDLSKPSDLAKLCGWVIWVNLVLPEFTRGVYKMFKQSDAAFLWQPIVSIVLTDSLIIGFVTSEEGRRFIKNYLLRSFFVNPNRKKMP